MTHVTFAIVASAIQRVQVIFQWDSFEIVILMCDHYMYIFLWCCFLSFIHAHVHFVSVLM